MAFRFKEISLANWPRIAQPAKLLNCHHLVYRHLEKRGSTYNLYIIFVWNSKFLVTGPLKSHRTLLWSHLLLFEGGMGLESSLLCWYLCVCDERCDTATLDHGLLFSWSTAVRFGSRIRGNTWQPVAPRHHLFPVLCAVGKWWLMLLCLPPCQEKPFAVFTVFLLLCHGNAVNKEPGPVWCRAACAWLGSAPLPGAPESCPGLMWQLCAYPVLWTFIWPGGALLCQMADVVQDIQD